VPERRDPLLETCRDIIVRGSKSFAGAARLFAPETRDAAYLLYAWCRYCDDQIDGETLGFRTGDPSKDLAGQQGRLRRLQDMTHRVLEGRSVDDPVFMALQRVVQRYRIPDRYPLELLEGFAMDVDCRRYHRLDETITYCYHVAGVVGLMMSHIMGVREEAIHRRAADLGIALQMTNIARDVVDDARVGRVYLPLEWLQEAGLTSEELLAEHRRGCVARVVSRLLAEADRYYASGDHGMRRLPFRSAWAVTVARGVYWEIGQVVRSRGHAAWNERAVASRLRKGHWLARGLLTATVAATVGRWLREEPRPDLWTRRLPEAE
jgi:phytoene synthase